MSTFWLTFSLVTVLVQSYAVLHEWTEVGHTSTDELTTIIETYPFTHYEYAIYFNSALEQPLPIQFNTWNGKAPRFSIIWQYPQCKRFGEYYALFFVFRRTYLKTYALQASKHGRFCKAYF